MPTREPSRLSHVKPTEMVRATNLLRRCLADVIRIRKYLATIRSHTGLHISIEDLLTPTAGFTQIWQGFYIGKDTLLKLFEDAAIEEDAQ